MMLIHPDDSKCMTWDWDRSIICEDLQTSERGEEMVNHRPHVAANKIDMTLENIEALPKIF